MQKVSAIFVLILIYMSYLPDDDDISVSSLSLVEEKTIIENGQAKVSNGIH